MLEDHTMCQQRLPGLRAAAAPPVRGLDAKHRVLAERPSRGADVVHARTEERMLRLQASLLDVSPKARAPARSSGCA
jgi:hypothetical protein